MTAVAELIKKWWVKVGMVAGQQLPMKPPLQEQQMNMVMLVKQVLKWLVVTAVVQVVLVA